VRANCQLGTRKTRATRLPSRTLAEQPKRSSPFIRFTTTVTQFHLRPLLPLLTAISTPEAACRLLRCLFQFFENRPARFHLRLCALFSIFALLTSLTNTRCLYPVPRLISPPLSPQAAPPTYLHILHIDGENIVHGTTVKTSTKHVWPSSAGRL
jgi:hypothetical protein